MCAAGVETFSALVEEELRRAFTFLEVPPILATDSNVIPSFVLNAVRVAHLVGHLPYYIKDCSNCTFPHDPQNYEAIIVSTLSEYGVAN